MFDLNVCKVYEDQSFNMLKKNSVLYFLKIIVSVLCCMQYLVAVVELYHEHLLIIGLGSLSNLPAKREVL